MRSLIAVLAGGVIGTALRLLLDDLIVHHDDTFPWDTLFINIAGSFVLAVFVARLWPIAPDWVRAGLGPGLVGGFTTFSAVMASMVTLAAAGEITLALAYIAASLVFGFGAAALGFWVARPSRKVPTIGIDE